MIRAHMVAVGFALAACFASSLASAATATLSARQDEGYARLVYTFEGDAAPALDAKLLGGVLVVSFSQNVSINVGHVAAAVPGFVQAARRDPDGRATRFALGRDVRLNVTNAGDKVFVDLLPANWRGLPPPLPREVIEALAARARQVDEMRMELQRLTQARRAPVGFEAGTHASFTRLIFRLPEPVDVDFGSADGEGNLTIGLPLQFDLAAARAAVSPDIVALSARITDDKLVISLSARDARAMRGFREDDSFVIDLLNEEAPVAPPQVQAVVQQAPEEAVVQPAVLAPPEPAKPSDGPPPAAAAEPPTAEPANPAANAGPESAARPVLGFETGHHSLMIAMPFAIDVPTALFARGTHIYFVVDSKDPIDPEAFVKEGNGLIRSARVIPTGPGQALEIETDEVRLATLARRETQWSLQIGEGAHGSGRPVTLMPGFTENGRAIVQAELSGAGTVHWVDAAGGRRGVVTAGEPMRSLSRPREFVEFRAFATMHGLAFEPIADDVSIKVAGDRVEVSRDEGLTISVDAVAQRKRATALRANSPFDITTWRAARNDPVRMANELARVAAQTEGGARTSARIALARHYLANGNAAETKAIIDIARGDAGDLDADANVQLMRGAALVMLGRFEPALDVLGAPVIADSGEAALWRMTAEAALGRVGAARRSFDAGRGVLAALPEDLQLLFRQTMVEILIAVDEFPAAAAELDALEALGLPEGQPRRMILRGKIAEGQQQPRLALEAYRRALEGRDDVAAADARLLAALLRHSNGDTDNTQTISELENFTAMWRGDMIEADALAALSRLYAEERRWREAFTAMRVLTQEHPTAEVTREVGTEMGALFARLFLGEEQDAAPPTLEMVALFYDFSALTPAGRRGDAVIRRLADRLADADLLEQAAELLEYQITNRLQGAARAEVAANAAVMHLMNRKPARAQQILDRTRFANLPGSIAKRRLMLEARALADLSRTDLALELVEDLEGPDVGRLRSDALWSARRWQAAAEMLELNLQDKWRREGPLSEGERQDVLRAAIGYALAGDVIGSDRLRAKYGIKMSGTPDVHGFDIATAPADLRGSEFQEMARAISMTDTLDRFLTDYRARYEEAPAQDPAGDPPASEARDDRTADARG